MRVQKVRASHAVALLLLLAVVGVRAEQSIRHKNDNEASKNLAKEDLGNNLEVSNTYAQDVPEEASLVQKELVMNNGTVVFDESGEEEDDEAMVFKREKEHNKFEDKGATRVGMSVNPRAPLHVNEHCSIQEYIKDLRNTIVDMYEPVTADYFKQNVEYSLGPESLTQDFEYSYMKAADVKGFLTEKVIPLMVKNKEADKESFTIDNVLYILDKIDDFDNRYIKWVVPRPTPTLREHRTLVANLDFVIVDTKAGPYNTLVVAYSSMWKAKLRDYPEVEDNILDIYQFMKKTLFDIMLRRLGPQGTGNLGTH